ncbi:hypothetical protein D3C72_1305630 [compost metagenome]
MAGQARHAHAGPDVDGAFAGGKLAGGLVGGLQIAVGKPQRDIAHALAGGEVQTLVAGAVEVGEVAELGVRRAQEEDVVVIVDAVERRGDFGVLAAVPAHACFIGV